MRPNSSGVLGVCHDIRNASKCQYLDKISAKSNTKESKLVVYHEMTIYILQNVLTTLQNVSDHFGNINESRKII